MQEKEHNHPMRGCELLSDLRLCPVRAGEFGQEVEAELSLVQKLGHLKIPILLCACLDDVRRVSGHQRRPGILGIENTVPEGHAVLEHAGRPIVHIQRVFKVE